MSAAEAIALHPWNAPATLFAVLDHVYPALQGPGSRAIPFRPYLLFAPGAWTIALRYAGGGLAGLGGIGIDGEGDAWAANNQMAGSQSTMYGGIGGTLSEIASDGQPLSPMTTGYTGGGVDFPGWGLTIAGDGKVWVTSIGGKTISVFDERGLSGENPDEAVSTRCGGNGFVVFFGLAKPVRTPVVGSQMRPW